LDFSERVNPLQDREPLFQRTGVLWLAHADDPYAVKCAETLARTGVPFERLTTAELARRYPQIAIDEVSWALLEPESGALMARRAVQTVVGEAIKEGASYRQDSIRAPIGKGHLEMVQTQKRSRHLGRELRFRLWSLAAKTFFRSVGRTHSTKPAGGLLFWSARKY